MDNEEDILFVIKRLLKHYPLTVYTAQNGKEALEKIEASIPDVIMADIKMPVMNGFELIERLRHHHNTKINTLPVIAITAFGGEAFCQQATAAGFNTCLFKPFDEMSVIKMIQSCAPYFT